MREAFSRPALLPLPGGPFRIWSQGVVRATGFSVTGLNALGCPDYADAVDAMLAAQADGRSDAELTALEEEVRAASAAASARQAQALAGIAGRERFRTAVAWQNRAVVQPMVDALAAAPVTSPGNQSYRRKQRLVAKYWTRYCAKNDTIGFFGPASWFTLDDSGPAVTVAAGPELMKWADTHFEGWVIDKVAATLSADPEIRPWVAPRLHPAMYHVPGMLIQPEAPPASLDPHTDLTLRLCDGERPARDVADALVAAHPDRYPDQAAVFARLDELVGKGWLFWDLEPPLHQDPDLSLRARLQLIGEPAVRDRALAALDTLVAARDKVAGAESADTLLTTMSDLDEAFVELTGAEPSQRAGITYGARQTVYQDGERDLRLEFGPAMMAAASEPLSLMLLGARWLTQRLADHYEQVFAAAFDQMLAQYGGDSVNFMMLAYACGNELFVPGERGSDKIMAEFANLWRDALGMDKDTALVEITSAELAERLGPVFADAGPGWAYATHHGVDLQIAATSVEAMRAGDFEPVIGEIHPAWNTLQSAVLATTHPDREALLWLFTAGVAPRIELAPVKSWPRVTARTVSLLDNGQDWWMSVSEFPGGQPERHLALSELSVRRNGETLEVVNGDGSAVFGILDVIGVWMAEDIGEAFKGVASGQPHTPRVRIDRLVAFRETWMFPAAGLNFVNEKSEDGTFVEFRRWLRDTGLPRYVFAKVTGEMKPFFVDFTSPVQVANLVTSLRTAIASDQGVKVSFVEMHPDPEHCWLPDGAGNTYTSEFRMQAVDCVRPFTNK